MLPDPLHPAVVHVPIALALVLPLMALGALVAIGREWGPHGAWVAIVLMQALFVGSAWLAKQTGEDEEDRVEAFVAERYIHDHEEGGERLFLFAGATLLVLGAGLLPRRAGTIARLVGTLVTVGVFSVAITVGRSGGALVYEHGAANAYLPDRTALEPGSASDSVNVHAADEAADD